MFFNTISVSGQTLIDYNQHTYKQDAIIESVFLTNPESCFTPFEIQSELIKFGFNYPITSIRRAINTLTKENKLQKLSTFKNGIYGKPNHTWRKAKNIGCFNFNKAFGSNPGSENKD